MTSWLYPGPFKTTRACTHSPCPSKSLVPTRGKGIGEEHPGLFRDASKNMCFLQALLYALSTGHQKRIYAILGRGGPGGTKGTSLGSQKKKMLRNLGVLPWSIVHGSDGKKDSNLD